jgi:hypothetical protein
VKAGLTSHPAIAVFKPASGSRPLRDGFEDGCRQNEKATHGGGPTDANEERVMSDSEVPWYVSLIVSWLPFLMLLGLGWYIGRQIRRSLVTKDGRSLADVCVELTNELKRANDRSNSN